MKLAVSEDAPHQSVRPAKSARAIHGFGDASKDGFGASIEVEGKGIVWRSGAWSLFVRQESSNFREFRNLLEMIAALVDDGSLVGHEFFMFTDNSTAEATFFKRRELAKSCLILSFDSGKRRWKETCSFISFMWLAHE